VVMIPPRPNRGWVWCWSWKGWGRFGYRGYAWHREQRQGNFGMGRSNPQMQRDQRQVGIGNLVRDQRQGVTGNLGGNQRQMLPGNQGGERR
jgi:hypothetical protein